MATQNKSCFPALNGTNIFTPTGNYEDDKNRGIKYAKEVGMDEANTKMAVVMATEGPQEAAKKMLSEFTTPEGVLDYAAMRARYG